MRSPARGHGRGVAIAIGLAVVAALGACRRSAPQEANTGPVPVVAAKARTETLRDTLTATGTVVPSTAADWTVIAPESAQIAELPHAEGDIVKEGDVLVRYDIPALTAEVTSRQADVSAAASRLDAAKKELDKISALDAQGLVARNDLNAKKAAVIDAQSAVTTAQGQLDRANAAMGRTKVTARFAGKIVQVLHKEGDVVVPSASDPILRIVDLTRLQVAIRLSIHESQRVRAGQTATVMGPASVPEPATVALVPMAADAAATSVDVRLNFAQVATLAPDTPVEVEIVLDVREGATVVPRAAIQKEEDVTYVMLIDPENRVHRREVKVGMMTRDLAQIVTGLALGDRVVVSAPGQLVEGMLVQPDK